MNSVKRLINNFCEFKYNKYFKYFSLLGAAFFSKLFLKILYSTIQNINFFSQYDLSTYENGWIIFLDGSKEYVVDLSINLLNKNQKYKILLLGDEEYKLKGNSNKINQIFKNAVVQILPISDSKVKFENDLKIILNHSPVSIVYFNSDYCHYGRFDKLDQNKIREILYRNFSLDYMVFNILINKEFNQKHRILFICFSNLLAKYKIPFFQIYSSIKIFFRKALKIDNLKNCEKYDICYIDDFLEKTNMVYTDPNSIKYKYTFLDNSNIIMNILMKNYLFLKNYRKRILYENHLSNTAKNSKIANA